LSLVEVLVVIAVAGALAAIAIPAFSDQESKGIDAEAKSNAVTVTRAIESCAAEYGGRYERCSKEVILEVQPSLRDAADRLTVEVLPGSYEIAVASRRDPAVSFKVTRASDGTTTRSCTTNGDRGGCLVPTTGTW
jgi:type II secretory pathway pseudopilin PulG